MCICTCSTATTVVSEPASHFLAELVAGRGRPRQFGKYGGSASGDGGGAGARWWGTGPRRRQRAPTCSSAVGGWATGCARCLSGRGGSRLGSADGRVEPTSGVSDSVGGTASAHWVSRAAASTVRAGAGYSNALESARSQSAALGRANANPSLPTTKLNHFRISGLHRQKCPSGTTNAYEPGNRSVRRASCGRRRDVGRRRARRRWPAARVRLGLPCAHAACVHQAGGRWR